MRNFWLGLVACFDPNGVGGGGGNQPPAPSPAPSTAPAQPSAQPSAPSQTPIDHAFDQMRAPDFDFDLPPDPSQDSWSQPVQPSRPAAPPSYPQPVVPGQQPGQQPAQQPGQQPQQQPQLQPQAPAPQAQQQDPNAALNDRIRRDPFGLQADMIQQQEAQYIDALAKTVYPVTQDDVDAFLSGDGTRISSALARVHVNAVGSILRVVSQQMPFYVNNMLQLHTTARDRENSFWERNSFLDRQKHSKQALTAARVYRQMNPQAPDEEIDRMVGAMVAAAAGITPTAHVPAPGMRTPGPVVRQAPQAFSPAGTSAPGQPRKASPGNQWSEFAEILMADQSGRLDNVT